MSNLRLAACAVALTFFSGLTATAETVTGTASYRERIMPPPDARFVAVLSDISRADAAAIELGRVEIENAGGPPYAFEIEYDPEAIDQRHTYAVRATLWSGDRMMFTTDTVAPVLTNGASGEVDIVMVRVASKQPRAAVEPAQMGAHGLQLPATFTGQLPCADCEGISYHLDLWPDQGYHLRREWLVRDAEAGENIQDDVGFWYSDAEQQTLILSGLTDSPTRWQIKSPNLIRQLDMDGKVIESDLPYELTSNGTLNETDIENVFLGGMMTYMADAAVFKECRTGRLHPVAQEGEYLALERAYLADQSAPGEPLYVNVEGSLLMRPAVEGPDRRSLIVERFVRTRPGITCERQRADASLTNTYWRIDSLAGENVVGLPSGRQEPHMVLRTADEERFSATVGCNRMTGKYSQKNDMLSFGSGATTMMMCPPPLGDLEQTLVQTLAAVQSYRINGETLALFNKANEVIALMTAVYLQ